jgi:hypothetical protein
MERACGDHRLLEAEGNSGTDCYCSHLRLYFVLDSYWFSSWLLALRFEAVAITLILCYTVISSFSRNYVLSLVTVEVVLQISYYIILE